MSKFEHFAKLHVAGEPLVLFNAWDAGSAAAVAKSGAKAVATGSASVSMANGFGDGQEVPLDLALANAERVVNAVELPVTIDFEGGYATDPAGLTANGRRLAETGAIGCNFEDRVVGTDRLYDIADQVARLAAFRQGTGDDFFINMRTDLFLKAKPEAHDTALADQAIERGRAYADAGANGFFIPGLADLNLVERITRAVNLPVNAMHLPGGPTRSQWASAGIARVSHGPFPYMAMQEWLAKEAEAALAQ
jgi:2-methylisocitrate lyase-like PEP mutase family enzyme